MHDRLTDLLNVLHLTHAPSGLEHEMDRILLEHLTQLDVHPRQDAHGNIHIMLPGRTDGPMTLVSAHKDEVAVLIHRIDDDGKMWIEPTGGCMPGKYGEGPFDVVSRETVVEGVLCIGSTHASAQSPRIHKAKTGPIGWDLVYVDCKLDATQLRDRGVMIGDRAVPGRARKTPVRLPGGCVGGYAMDDKAGVALLLLLVARLLEEPPARPVCAAFTACEESGVSGAAYLSRQLDPHDFIAIEVAPVAEEYPVTMSDAPAIYFKDAIYQYSHDLSRELIDAGHRIGLECQPSVVRSFGSDASITYKAGLNGRCACIGFPTENTHGFELTRLGALENCVHVLKEHLTTP